MPPLLATANTSSQLCELDLEVGKRCVPGEANYCSHLYPFLKAILTTKHHVSNTLGMEPSSGDPTIMLGVGGLIYAPGRQAHMVLLALQKSSEVSVGPFNNTSLGKLEVTFEQSYPKVLERFWRVPAGHHARLQTIR